MLGGRQVVNCVLVCYVFFMSHKSIIFTVLACCSAVLNGRSEVL